MSTYIISHCLLPFMNNLEMTIKGLVVFVQEKGNLWPIMLYLKFLLVILVNDLQCCNFPYLVPPIFNSTVPQIALFSECPLLTDSNVRDVIQLISISKSALSQQFSIYTVNKIRGKKTTGSNGLQRSLSDVGQIGRIPDKGF